MAETVYHQPVSGQPVAAGTPFGRWFDSEEDSYRRTQKLGTVPAPLDFGWIGEAGCGMLLLANSGRNVVMVGRNGVGVARIRPGESLRFEPQQTDGWEVVSLGGASRLDVLAVPL